MIICSTDCLKTVQNDTDSQQTIYENAMKKLEALMEKHSDVLHRLKER